MCIIINYKKYLKLLIFISLYIFIGILIIKSIHVPSNTNNMEFIVAIDPGHGSIDVGAHYNEIYEKDINLDIAIILAKKLKEVNIIPVLTRKDDSLYLNSRIKDIRHRPDIANKANADIFISIHVNNYPSSQPSGSQIFYKMKSSLSKDLAEKIQEELIKIRKENNRYIKSGDYYVLNKSKCPSIILEVGFLSNPEDRKKLRDPEYKELLAESIKNGIINYFQSKLGQENHELEKRVFNLKTSSEISNKFKLYYIENNVDSIYLVSGNLNYPTGAILNENYSKMNITEILAISAINQLLNPPCGKISPLAKGSSIKDISLNQGRLVVDFSGELASNYQGGIEMEQLIVQAITKTLFSIPNIDEMQILIDGEKGSSIGGHILLNNIYIK
jgi:N-acetylmuramoyl-L-alanine amidase